MLFDTVTYSGPNLEVTSGALRSFSLPHWNDAIFGGIPHLANAQAAALNPLKLPFAWSDTHRAIELMTVVNLALLAAGLFLLFAWRLRVRPPSALVGTLAVVGSGAIMARSIQFEQISVLAAAPWVLLTIDWVIREDRRPMVAVGCAALATGFLLVAGHPQQVYIFAPLALTWAITRMGDVGAWNAAPRLVAAAALGVGLSAAQLVPTALAVGDSAAVGTRGIDDVADPARSVTSEVLASTVFGDVFTSSPVSLSVGFEALIVVGAIVFTLAVLGAVVGLTARGSRWTTTGLLLVTAAAMILSFGPELRPYRTAFGHVPGFDLARVPARWSMLAVICVAILAAFGTDAIVRRRLSRQVVVSTTGAVGVSGLSVLVISADPSARTAAAWVVAVVAVLGAMAVARWRPRWALMAAVVVAALMFVELGALQRHSIARSNLSPVPFTDLDSEVSEFIASSGDRAFVVSDEDLSGSSAAATLRPNSNALFGVRTIDGYDGGTQVTERWVDAVSPFGQGDHIEGFPIRNQLTPPLDLELLADLGVRWVVIDLDNEAYGVDALLSTAGEPVLVADGFGVWENPVFSGEAILRWEGSPIPADVSRPGPGRIRIVTDAPEESVLVVAEQFSDGWSSTVDGTTADVFAVDGFHLGVVVPPGIHEVQLDYRTPGLTAGLVVSALSLLGVVVLISWPVLRRVASPDATGTRPDSMRSDAVGTVRDEAGSSVAGDG